MGVADLVYDAGVQVARPLVAAAAPLSSKLQHGLRGRRDAVGRLVYWGQSQRAAGRPLVWLHAPSVGESLMTQAIIGALRQLRPELQITFTHFSPSAERIATEVGADVTAYLPWDTRSNMRAAVGALRPTVVAFVRSEIWPMLIRAATGAGGRSCLVNAVLGPASSRLKRPARWVLSSAYRRLQGIGAIGRNDAERFSRFGVDPRVVRVTGDARFDQVWVRVQQLDRNQPLLQRLADERVTTLVAGSTWPADERELLPAFAKARKGRPLRLVLVPHEPTPNHLRDIDHRLNALGLKHARLARLEATGAAPPEVVVVDRIGVLADLYAVATVAYVGGGFETTGLHSVVEPAALGIPVVFGPRHGNAREADELAGKGGGFVASDGASIASIVLDLAARPLHRAKASEAARAYVQSRLGAARRNAELIVELIR